MAHDDVAEQTLVEHRMLHHIADGLRTAIGWQPEAGDITRKLSTIRFIAGSLQRHLDRLLALEEDDGYMGVVLSQSPRLGRQVDALRAEHDRFREAAHGAVYRLDRVTPVDPVPFDAVCEELLALLRQLDEHTARERTLLQEAFGDEVGGEG